MNSTTPPITVPAWSCMMSSKDPGTLGFYGFRNRKDHSYDGMAFATSEKVHDDRLCDEIRDVVGEYMVDVPDYRTDDRERVVRDINEMTRRRFKLARHLRDT